MKTIKLSTPYMVNMHLSESGCYVCIHTRVTNLKIKFNLPKRGRGSAV